MLALSGVVCHSPILQWIETNHYLLYIQICIILEYIIGVLLNIYQIPFHYFRMTFQSDYGYYKTTA